MSCGLALSPHIGVLEGAPYLVSRSLIFDALTDKVSCWLKNSSRMCSRFARSLAASTNENRHAPKSMPAKSGHFCFFMFVSSQLSRWSASTKLSATPVACLGLMPLTLLSYIAGMCSYRSLRRSIANALTAPGTMDGSSLTTFG